MGIFNNFSSVAQVATLVNFTNLHKSNIVASDHLENLTFNELKLHTKCVMLVYPTGRSIPCDHSSKQNHSYDWTYLVSVDNGESDMN